MWAALTAGVNDGGAAAGAIAVMDFANVTGDPESAWLSTGIAETVTGDLPALDHLRVVDRWRVTEAVRATDGSLQQVAHALGARFAVVVLSRPRRRPCAAHVDRRRARARDDGVDDVGRVRALIVQGIHKRYAPIRSLAFVIFGVTIVKVFIVDLAELDRIYRV